MTSGRLHAVTRTAAVLFCVAGAPVVVLLLVRSCFGVPVSAFRPFLSDEVSYWHQTLTFSTMGFSGGYYTTGELTNPSGTTPFGPHGPGFPIAYGLFGMLFGWYRHTPVVLNLAAIAAAAWTWTILSKLPTARTVLSGVLLVTFWPMAFWAPTGMQEALHHAGAIAMAGFFTHALASSPRRLVTAFGWITLAALSFIRPTWLVLLPLWAFATAHAKGRRAIVLTSGCAAVLAVLVLAAYSRTTAPFPTGFFFLRVLDQSVSVARVWQNLRFNLVSTIEPQEYKFLEVLLRVQYWGTLVAVMAIMLTIWLRRRAGERSSASNHHLVLGPIAMAVALGLMLALYRLSNWAEHRVLSAFLLFAVLLCTASPGRSGVLVASMLLASNVATIKPFLDSFNAERGDNFVWDRRGSYELSDAIEGRIVYRPDASRWCNTLLTSQYPPHLIVVPAGIGISVVREPNEMRLPPRSHYLLIDDTALADFNGPLRTTRLVRLPYGTLYLNLDAECPSLTASRRAGWPDSSRGPGVHDHAAAAPAHP
jgi:hypothetical protein